MPLHSCLFHVSAHAACESQLAFMCLVLMFIGIAASVQSFETHLNRNFSCVTHCVAYVHDATLVVA